MTKTIILLAFFTMFGELSWAQTAPVGFVDATVGTAPDDWYHSSDVWTMSSGFTAGIGSNRSGVQFEFNQPQWHTSANTLTTSPYFYAYSHPTLPGSNRPGTIQYSSEGQRRAVTYDVLSAHHAQLAERVRISWLVGGGFAYRPWHTNYTTQLTLSTGEVVTTDQHTQDGSRNYLTAVGGLDTQILLNRHIALVPELRVHAYPFAVLDDSCCGPAAITAEPRIAVRFRF
jgi:hypothetical protein